MHPGETDFEKHLAATLRRREQVALYAFVIAGALPPSTFGLAAGLSGGSLGAHDSRTVALLLLMVLWVFAFPVLAHQSLTRARNLSWPRLPVAITILSILAWLGSVSAYLVSFTR